MPAYRIDILLRRENVDRWDDRLLLKTNLIDSYLKALAFIKDKWPEKFHQGKNGERIDLRELIFRELVGNIIIHREYNSATPTEVVIYEDRVETTNPNRMRFRGTLDLDKFDAEPKNPNIRAFFNILTWADEIGSGVKNMNKFVIAYTGGAHPLFVEDEPFLSVIPMIIYQVGDMYRIYRSLAQLKDEELGEDRLKQLISYPLDLSMKGLSDWDEIAFHLVRSWKEKSGKFDDFRFLINNNINL